MFFMSLLMASLVGKDGVHSCTHCELTRIAGDTVY